MKLEKLEDQEFFFIVFPTIKKIIILHYVANAIYF